MNQSFLGGAITCNMILWNQNDNPSHFIRWLIVLLDVFVSSAVLRIRGKLLCERWERSRWAVSLSFFSCYFIIFKDSCKWPRPALNSRCEPERPWTCKPPVSAFWLTVTGHNHRPALPPFLFSCKRASETLSSWELNIFLSQLPNEPCFWESNNSKQ